MKDDLVKRVGFLFEKICERENIVRAIENSSKGKRRRERVQRILDREDVYVEQIREMLVEKTYVPGGYIEEQIWDQNVHWCLMRGMYYCQTLCFKSS